MALASNSPKSLIEQKISKNRGWKESFSAIVGIDEVKAGKPSPGKLESRLLKVALAAQFDAEVTPRRVHVAQKDDDIPPIEAIIAPLEAKL